MSIISRGAAAVALAVCVGLSGQAMAQAPAPAPAQQRKPAAQPAPPPAAPAAPAPQSNRVELIATQPEWTKVCGKDEAANKEICYTTRDFGQAADQAPVLAVAIYDVKGDEQRIVRLLLPVGLMLRPGFRFSIDKGAAIEGNYEICFPNGCFAEARIKGATLDGMKKGSLLNVNVKNQVNNEVIFVVPLAGFGKAFDGAAIDPKVLEEQQKQLQADLQKRAEEERKRLEGEIAVPGAPPAAAPR